VARVILSNPRKHDEAAALDPLPDECDVTAELLACTGMEDAAEQTAALVDEAGSLPQRSRSGSPAWSFPAAFWQARGVSPSGRLQVCIASVGPIGGQSLLAG
jgi:hypothetical protein